MSKLLDFFQTITDMDYFSGFKPVKHCNEKWKQHVNFQKNPGPYKKSNIFTINLPLSKYSNTINHQKHI